MLKMEHVKKSYYNGRIITEVLHGIDLDIKAGEMVAIMGASGSGKSTLLGILGTLDGISSGHYEIDGNEVSSLSQSQLCCLRNEKLGFVFQKFHLMPDKSAIENVMLPVYYNRKISNKEGRKRARQMLERVNMGDRINDMPAIMSGGECQRIAIARALVNNPEVLFADEPTGNLDSKNSQEVMQLFMDIHKDLKNTMVIVTHNDDIGKMCERVLIMHDGNITNQNYNF